MTNEKILDKVCNCFFNDSRLYTRDMFCNVAMEKVGCTKTAAIKYFYYFKGSGVLKERYAGPKQKLHTLDQTISKSKMIELVNNKRLSVSISHKQSSPSIKSVVYKLTPLIEGGHLNVHARLPHGQIQHLCHILNIDKIQLKNAIDVLRIAKNISLPPGQKRSDPENEIRSLLLKNEQFRGAPSQEFSCCRKIDYAITYMIPYGGLAYIMGTPSPMSTSNNSPNKHLSFDNLGTIKTIYNSTRKYPTLIIGDYISRPKAEFKQYYFSRIDLTANCPVILTTVDRNAIISFGSKLATLTDIPILVLMTSGVWEASKNTQRKYKGLDVQFKLACEHLAGKFPHMHILAMKRSSRVCVDVIYLHDNKQTILTEEI